MARPSKPVEGNTFVERIAAEIRRRRERKKLLVAEAAAAAGVPVQTWYHWEQARHLPLDRLPAISAALDASRGTWSPAESLESGPPPVAPWTKSASSPLADRAIPVE